MRNLNEMEMNLVSGGIDDSFPPSLPNPPQGPTLQDIINAWNATHPAHPMSPA